MTGSYLVPCTTRERAGNKRGNLLYVDDSQNDFADTIASAYSVRPIIPQRYPHLWEWKEVISKLDPSAFTIQTIKKRIQKKGDLFRNVTDGRLRRSNDQNLSAFLTEE